MTELSYADFWNEIDAKIRPAEAMVLATCSGGRVTTRTICPLSMGEDILFSTNDGSLKITQIRENPNIALALDGINVEAVAQLYGHPDSHPTFMKEYAAKYPGVVSTYESSPDGMLVIAKPTVISVYRFVDGKACKDILDVPAHRAYRVEL